MANPDGSIVLRQMQQSAKRAARRAVRMRRLMRQGIFEPTTGKTAQRLEAQLLSVGCEVTYCRQGASGLPWMLPQAIGTAGAG